LAPRSSSQNGCAELGRGIERITTPFRRRPAAERSDAGCALVGVPLWEHAAAVLVILASIYPLLPFAGGIYADGLLHSGPRIPLRTASRLGR
jgi:hypothetical protein